MSKLTEVALKFTLERNHKKNIGLCLCAFGPWTPRVAARGPPVGKVAESHLAKTKSSRSRVVMSDLVTKHAANFGKRLEAKDGSVRGVGTDVDDGETRGNTGYRWGGGGGGDSEGEGNIFGQI